MHMPIWHGVTRRKHHRPGVAPNANTTHVPTAGSRAAPTKPNHTPSRHSRAKGKLLLQTVTPHAAGSRRTHVSRTQECVRTHPVTDALLSYSRARPPTRQPASPGPTCHCSSGQRHWPEPSAHGWPGASRTPAPPHLAALGVACGTDITPAGRGHKPCCAGLWAVCTRGASHAADPPGPSPVQRNTDPSTPAAQAWQAPRAPYTAGPSRS